MTDNSVDMPDPATDYSMTNAAAEALKGIVLHPHDIRRAALSRWAEQHGTDALVALFSQFIGMANSVVANNRDCIELFGIQQGEHPHSVEKYNLPTIFGALCGVALANATDQRKMCHGCAYRLGTPANQSPVTTLDAEYAVACSPRHEFLCHERELDTKGEPTTLCLGYRQALRGKDQTDD